FQAFYKYLQQALTESVMDFSEVWEHALDKLLKQSALKQEEAAILSQFGKNLGKHTFLQQEKHIHLTMHHLKEILNNAIDEQHKYERMAKSLGVLAGIFIVLLLYFQGVYSYMIIDDTILFEIAGIVF